MKTKKLVVLIFTTCTLLSNLPLATAGDRVGNGGVSVVCRNSARNVESAKLLDIYEAENDPTLNLKIPRTHRRQIGFEKALEETQEALKKADTRLAVDLKHFLRKIRPNIRPFNNPSVRIPLPKDFNARVEPQGPNCNLESVAKYMPDGQIQLDSSIFSKMDVTDQVALYVHEALYLAARENRGVSDSDSSRLLVSHLFSDDSASTVSIYADALLEIKTSPSLSSGQKIIIRRNCNSTAPEFCDANIQYWVKRSDGDNRDAFYGMSMQGQIATGLIGRFEMSYYITQEAVGAGQVWVYFRKSRCVLNDQKVGIKVYDAQEDKNRMYEIDFNKTDSFELVIDVR